MMFSPEAIKGHIVELTKQGEERETNKMQLI